MSKRASGVITLTSDFGLRDPFVGVMKGRILARHPDVQIVDLTHEILAHWPAEAGFWLARSFEYFPPASVHVAVVDPGVGTARDILVVESRGHVFLAPDNGLLAPVLTRDPQAVARRIDSAALVSLGIARPSATFHGRDIFAPLAAELARGALTAGALGPVTPQIVPSWVDEPQRTLGRVSGVVITVDHFGNLLTNIDKQFLEGMMDPLVVAGHLSLPLRRTYGDVRPGDPIALVNSFDVVEIAVAERRATEVLGLSRGAPVTVRDAVRRA